jgi:hypothetical protein
MNAARQWIYAALDSSQREKNPAHDALREKLAIKDGKA